MTVGYVRQREIKSKDGQVIKWFEMSIRVPFGSCTLTMSKRKPRDNDSANVPDYDLWFSPNRKGETYDRMNAGSLWLKTSEKGNQYLSGNIETPLVPSGKMYISVVKYKPIEGMPVQPILYNVLWNPPQERRDDYYGSYDPPQERRDDYGSYDPPQAYGQNAAHATTQQTNFAGDLGPNHDAYIPEVNIDESEIPF